jgi:hypothetical protein
MTPASLNIPARESDLPCFFFFAPIVKKENMLKKIEPKRGAAATPAPLVHPPMIVATCIAE